MKLTNENNRQGKAAPSRQAKGLVPGLLLIGAMVLAGGGIEGAYAKGYSASKATATHAAGHGTTGKSRQARAVKRAKVASRQVGKASWYGPGFHGRKTASGAIFNQNQMTAAHRRLPLGTRARVTNLRNGKSVNVVINDRGPFIGGRIIDLSRAAAQRLAISGVGQVRVEALP